MVQAFVLIQTESGKASEVARSIAGIDGVQSSEAVTGPYDVIVAAEAPDVDALGQLVVNRIQPVAGIVRTLTCPVVKL
jgi:DNA-binding Lrp family transcriptional regulator